MISTKILNKKNFIPSHNSNGDRITQQNTEKNRTII